MAHSIGSTYMPIGTPTSGSTQSSSPSIPAPPPPTKATYAFLDDTNLFCEWFLTATNCREERITQNILIASSVVHSVVAVYAVWLIIKRSGGVSRNIFTGLFTKVGNRVQPRPTHWVIFCFALAFAPKPISDLILVFDVLRRSLWVRVLFEQHYWATIAVLAVMYIVGLLYTIPVTRREGFIAIFEPERADGCDYYEPVDLIYPTPLQINIFIVVSIFTIITFAVGPAVVSALLYNRGDFEASKVWLTMRHAVWIWIFFVLSIVFIYYGIKFTRILKTNIIIAETRLGMPYTRFGLTNLISKSPARYLFIMQQLTVFGAVALAIAITLISSSFIIFRDKILAAQLGLFSHFYALAWTCALSFFGAAKLALVHVQLIRNRSMRRRLTGLYGPIDGKEYSHGTGTDLDQARGPAREDSYVAREMDLRFLTSDCEIENMADITTVWSSIHNASSSSKSDPVSSTVREYIRHFSSEGVSILPTSTILPPNVKYGPSRFQWDDQTREFPMPSLLANASRNTEDLSPKLRVESGVHNEAHVQSTSMIIHDPSQKALRNLGILQD